MSRAGEIVLEFGGEERTFRLGVGQWRKIQEVCDAGPAELLARLSPAFAAAQQGIGFAEIVGMGLLGRWRVDDVREPVRQGLLGALDAAGKPVLEAKAVDRLVVEYVDERPLLESVVTAYKVVLASVVGVDDEAASGEPRAAAEGAPSSPAASSASERTASTPSAPPAASAPATSTP